MNQPELEAQLLKLIQPLPSAFVEAGLEFEGRTAIETPFGQVPVYSFIHSKSHVRLKLSLGEHRIIVVSVSVGDRWFSLDDYLVHHHRLKEKAELFELSQDMPQLLDYLCQLVSKEWREILNGTRWEDIPYGW